MEYAVGKELIWIRRVGGEHEAECVVVTGIKKHGAAKLSNGWVVDADGVAEGTSRMPGGFVVEPSKITKDGNA